MDKNRNIIKYMQKYTGFHVWFGSVFQNPVTNIKVNLHRLKKEFLERIIGKIKSIIYLSYLLIKKYKLHGTLLDMPRPVQPGKLSLEHLKIIDNALKQDEKTSAVELHRLLREAGRKSDGHNLMCKEEIRLDTAVSVIVLVTYIQTNGNTI